MTLKQIQAFILWCRKERITYHTIAIGGVTLEGVVDGKHVPTVTKKPEPPQSLYDKYGAELLKQPVPAAEVVPEEALLDD